MVWNTVEVFDNGTSFHLRISHKEPYEFMIETFSVMEHTIDLESI